MNVPLETNYNPSVNPLYVVGSFSKMSDEAFENWRRVKLRRAKDAAARVGTVAIEDPTVLSNNELHALRYSIESLGYALYKLSDRDKEFGANELVALSAQLGLHHLDKNRCAYDDGISRIQDDASGEQKHYIPYSNKALNWHTDGYYNETEHRVKAFALHCIRAASAGGDSMLMDHEVIYLLMREHNHEMAAAMFREDAMAIPVNEVDKANLREEQVGPVFWQDPISGGLQMRYTARTRSIRWNDDKLIRDGVAFITELLKDSSYATRYKLKAGEGVISNNCLHARTSFDDGQTEAATGRLLLRARFFDRTSSYQQ